MATELAKTEGGQLAQVQPTILEIVARAVQDGRPASELTDLLQFAREVRKDEAERAFNTAFARFKAQCPAIVRNTTDANPNMKRVNRAGVSVQRKYASIYDISSVVDKHLTDNGLSYDWADAEISPTGLLTRKFNLRHAEGHSRSTCSPPIPIEGTEAFAAMSGGRKDSSASPQQRYGIADTYAMRYSMIAGLGLTTCDEDTDGAAIGNVETISESDVLSLNDALIQVHADLPAFLTIFRIEKLADLPAKRLDEAWAKIEAKRKKLGATK